ncbi:hypothetical protein BC830DRAFT_1167587 [Chytriomyces sp. MP71]|nr:hypothetical protein BC830DRAFT_1167587 [Chytriomyces sp. MP71]
MDADNIKPTRRFQLTRDYVPLHDGDVNAVQPRTHWIHPTEKAPRLPRSYAQVRDNLVAAFADKRSITAPLSQSRSHQALARFFTLRNSLVCSDMDADSINAQPPVTPSEQTGTRTKSSFKNAMVFSYASTNSDAPKMSRNYAKSRAMGSEHPIRAGPTLRNDLILTEVNESGSGETPVSTWRNEKMIPSNQLTMPFESFRSLKQYIVVPWPRRDGPSKGDQGNVSTQPLLLPPRPRRRLFKLFTIKPRNTLPYSDHDYNKTQDYGSDSKSGLLNQLVFIDASPKAPQTMPPGLLLRNGLVYVEVNKIESSTPKDAHQRMRNNLVFS